LSVLFSKSQCHPFLLSQKFFPHLFFCGFPYPPPLSFSFRGPPSHSRTSAAVKLEPRGDSRFLDLPWPGSSRHDPPSILFCRTSLCIFMFFGAVPFYPTPPHDSPSLSPLFRLSFFPRFFLSCFLVPPRPPPPASSFPELLTTNHVAALSILGHFCN